MKMNKKSYLRRSALSLFEILIALAIGAIVLGTVFVAMNPGKQLAQARDSQRKSHVNVILNAIRENMADNRTGFVCATGALPTGTPKKMANGAGNYDIASCIVPNYLYAMPFDPSTSTAHYVSNTDYDSGYTVVQTTSTGQITVAAPAAETTAVSVMR